MKLEDEISRFFNGWTDGYEFSQALNAEGECVTVSEIKDIVRYFVKWQKEEMLKGAVEARMDVFKNLRCQTNSQEYSEAVRTICAGEKVKLIIIKEDV